MNKKIYLIMFDNGEPFEDYICAPYTFEESEETANATVEKLNKELEEDRNTVLDIVHDGTDEDYIDDPEKTKIVDDLESKYRVSMGLPYILSVDWFKRASFHYQTLEKKEAIMCQTLEKKEAIMKNLKNWLDVTKGIYRYVTAAKVAYEIHLIYWDHKLDILDARAKLYEVGEWFEKGSDRTINFFERSFMFKGTVQECLDKAFNDYKENYDE